MKFIAVAAIAAVVVTLAVADTPVWSTNLQTSTTPMYPQNSPLNANQVAATDENNLYVTDHNGTVYSINKATGAIGWKVQPNGNENGDTLYLVNAGNCLVFYGGFSLNGLNLTTGETLWTQYMNFSASNFIIRPLSGNKVVTYTSSQVNVIDTTTGTFVWGYSNQNLNVNQIEVGVEHIVIVTQMYTSTGSFNRAEVFATTTGTLVYALNGAVKCSSLHVDSEYLACTIGSGSSTQVEVMNFKTQQLAWKSNTMFVNSPILRTVGGVLMLASIPNKFAGIKGYVAAFDLANGATAFWNVSLGYSFSGLNKIYQHDGLIIASFTYIPNQMSSVEPTRFVAIDRATGNYFWAVNVPTNSESQVIFAKNSMLFPNVMGWSRLAFGSSPNTEPVTEFKTVAALKGMTTVIGEGDEYIVLAGSRVVRYSF